MKKVLITSGGTREYIDDVRVLTNISSGRLGARIAEQFLAQNKFERHMDPIINYEVHYVASETSIKPHFNGWYHADFIPHKVTDVQSVYNVMKELVPEMDIIIHCMAVSDFGFHPCSTKLKSTDTMAFIESLKNRIYQTTKILPMIKQWNPNCILIGFKFEVGTTDDEIKELAVKQIETCKSDAVLTNDKIKMKAAASHTAKLYYKDKTNDWLNCQLFNDKKEIAEGIFNFVTNL
jgi:phosphopantothenate---cysteine ligase (CTP)